MAAKTFDEMIAGLQFSTEEKKLFDNTLTKNPEIKEGWLRQDDYSRKMTEVSEKEKGIEAVKARNVFLEEWGDRVVPIWEEAVKDGAFDDDGKPLWKEKLSEKEAALVAARAEALAGGDMKPEELDKRVKEIVQQAGGATTEEQKALYAQEARKIAQEEFATGWQGKEKDFNEKTIPFIAGFAASAGIVAMRFEKETGEKWSEDRQKELYKLMETEKNYNPFVVEEKLLGPFRDKKKREEEIEAEVQKRVKTAPRAETGSGDEYIPQPGERKGALKEMLERSAEKEGDFMQTIADQARKAGQELRQDGKVGVA